MPAPRPPTAWTRRAIPLLALSLAACAATGSEAPVASAPGPAKLPHERVVEAARADASRRSGLRPAQLRVVTLESVTWPDGSLGCPQPGLQYTQALVPGYRIGLQVGAEVWNYHASERGGVVLCPPGRSQPPAAGGRN